MTKQKHIFRNVCKTATEVSHLQKYPFTQCFVEAPLAAITALSFLGFDATSLTHLYLWRFSHSSLQILSSPVRLDRRPAQSLHSYFQVSPEMFDRVHVRVLADWWSAAEMVVLLEGSPISTEELWSSVRVTIGFLVPSLTKALLPYCRAASSRKSLGGSKLIPFKNDGEPLCSWGPSML
jgi:hypothetical protein